MLHSKVELEKAYELPVVINGDMEELRDMERYAYIAQNTEKLTKCFDIEHCSRRDFLAMVDATLREDKSSFNISDELTKSGTDWFREQNFLENYVSV